MRCYPLQADQQPAHRSCVSLPRLPARDRQRLVINIWIEKQFVETRGATPKSFVLKGGTGKDHEAFFCGKCGTYVWSRYTVAPGDDALFVRAGTLDNPDAVTPDVHIFTRSKLRLGETAGRRGCVRDGLQNRRRVAGREQGAPASQPRGVKLDDRATESVRAVTVVQPRTSCSAYPALGDSDRARRKAIGR